MHDLGSLCLLHRTAIFALPNPDLATNVQHKDIRVIQACPDWLDFVNNNAIDSSGRILEHTQQINIMNELLCAVTVANQLREEDDKTVPIIELAIFFLGPWNDLKLLDAPDEESRLEANSPIIPCWLSNSRIVFDLVVNIGSN
ncbi:hypothetical protein HG530_015528 [Fusarium avenaceum]|nr:hypothetical protein HG530_015528 [Fusarium avenaceum]